MPTARGERWLSTEEASALKLDHAVRGQSTLVAGRVTLDEEHTSHVRAPRAGIVRSVPVEVGRHVKKGAVLMTIESGQRTTSIVSPIDGDVVALVVEAGQTVTGPVDVAVVADLDHVVVTADVIPQALQLGATVTFAVERYPDKRFVGKVDSLSPERQARIKTANFDRALIVGMAGTVRLEVETAGVWIARGALRTGGGVMRVKRAGGGRVSLVEVKVSVAFDGGAGFVAVTGLGEGDEVVVGGL